MQYVRNGCIIFENKAVFCPSFLSDIYLYIFAAKVSEMARNVATTANCGKSSRLDRGVYRGHPRFWDAGSSSNLSDFCFNFLFFVLDFNFLFLSLSNKSITYKL